ncbi:MAG: AbrB family transcriptional regulator, partial [Pseudomonadota bacterium]
DLAGPLGATIGTAGLGALLASLAGLPAAALVGSAAAVAAFALLGGRAHVPDRLRDGGFAAIACSLGAGITPAIFDDLARWPLSIAILLLALAAMVVGAVLLLERVFGHDRSTALLAATPGALSATLAFAAEGRGDVRAVAVMQSMRLFSITLALPLLLGLTAGPDETGGTVVSPETMSWPVALALFAGSYALGHIAATRGVPAPFLVGGLLPSTLLHVTGVVTGPPPALFVTLGLAVTGAVIGARFRGARRAEIARHATAAFCVVGFSSAIAALAALAAVALLGIPFGQAWVTYAPGGVETMAAMALALDYDPAFVAVHHLVRITVLIAALPILISRLTRHGTSDDVE